MQLVTKASLLAVLAVVLVPRIDTLVAAEVTARAGQSPPTAAQSPEDAAQLLPEVTPPSSDCFILGARSFSIPFTVDASGTQPVEVHLFVSRGPAEPWRLLDRKRPDVTVKEFQFTADEDGEYWFATRTIDARGHPHPAGAIRSQLKVYVDTTKPRVSLVADADASGQVHAVLAIKDATPLKNIQLRYVTDNVDKWQNVAIAKIPPDGKLDFTPSDAWKQLSLQFVATDTPGNQSVVSQLLRRPRLADSLRRRLAAAADSTPAQSTPFRIRASDKVQAKTVASPVIQLDRNKLRGPPSLVTAHGYAPDHSRVESALDGFRGAAFPSQHNAPTLTRPPRLAPAPRATPPPHGAPAAQKTPAPQVTATPKSDATEPSESRLPTSNSSQFGSVPPYGMTPQAPPRLRPTRPTEPMHAAGPAETVTPSLPATPTVSDSPFQMPPAPTNTARHSTFGPPSIRGARIPSTARLTQTTLPSPATPQQISNGFGLNRPQQSQAETVPPGAASPPESEKKPTRARTPAEAMRPITEAGAVPERQPEEIPAPKPDPSPKRYETMRSTPVETAIAMGRAPVRYSDSLRFSLAYELEAVGSQGVDAIELYGSTDGGKTWNLWGQDPDQISPFDIETKEQGVFGFRIVVVGRNGLASPRPLAGQSPDIAVVVDTTMPLVRITGAQYGEGDRIGSLVIRYQCEDANLTQRPIALSFSDSLDGPWTTIAAGLRNHGDYVWPADPRLPRQLYLRIDATDQAGNVGTYILDQPIDAQGLAPRARIRGFESLSGAQPPVADEQTARAANATLK